MPPGGLSYLDYGFTYHFYRYLLGSQQLAWLVGYFWLPARQPASPPARQLPAMSTVVTVASIHDYNVSIQQPTRHPLVSVVDFAQVSPLPRPPQVQALRFGFYGVFLKEAINCTLRYGRHAYDYQESTLVFVAPGQVVSME